MKIEKYRQFGKKMVVVVTENEAIALLATLADQLYQRKPPSGRTEMLAENGEYFDIRIDFKQGEIL